MASTAPLDQPDEVVPPMSAAQMSDQKLDDVLAGAWRPASDKARDTYRHPRKTLAFFGIRPDMTVIEITPGGGWYARILAPLLRDNGQYIAAITSPVSSDFAARQASSLRKLFASQPKVFGKAQIAQFDPATPNLGAPDSADMVLTFRNVHNWVQADHAKAMFKAFYNVLKPGGVLGVVDHRAAQGASLADVKGSGYLPQPYVVKLATQAGFQLDGSSEVNANPKDTKDYPKGVWTLPPTLTLGDKDKAKYQAIGESDRMTLRFVKPDTAAPAEADSSDGASS
ncbi:methyltransferase domain-containing protein [Oleiagrimonas sp. C23AA]|uniref:class I SAM-dependent methyltransferase n=1 Tax=Oleiagrimonas sp. C23AA TaxID=2719047 RepID=UPI001F0D2393|nr:methyltransferase domain-containing protein [Oleiagrimonas sp. C23AA]